MRILAFTPVEKVPETEMRAAMLAQTYGGAVDWMIARDNPHSGGDGYQNIQLAYEKMRRIAQAEHYDAVWIVEADTIPPDDALEKLYATLQETGADAVTGLYVLRHGVHSPNLFSYGRSVEIGSALEWSTLIQQREAVVRVSGGCMGCVLVRVSALDFCFETGGRHAPDLAWMTHNWKTGKTTLARLDVMCGHKEPSGNILHPKAFGMDEWVLRTTSPMT